MASDLVPRLEKLISTLQQTGLQQSNQPLYQVIYNLIKAIIQSNNAAAAAISGGSGGGGLANQHYLTHQNDLAQLPQSRELLAGTNVNFDDSVFGERTIDVTVSSLTEVFLTGADEVATLPNSRELLAGTGITFDDSIANERTISAPSVGGSEWSVLTNGDVTNPELVFAGGDVIMLHTP